jgi:hypothetical protein
VHCSSSTEAVLLRFIKNQPLCLILRADKKLLGIQENEKRSFFCKLLFSCFTLGLRSTPINHATLQEFVRITQFFSVLYCRRPQLQGLKYNYARGSTSPRSVRQTRTGTPCRSLKPAMAFLERVTTAFWPVINAMSRIVDSRVLAFWEASPIPQLTTTFSTCGIYTEKHEQNAKP